MWKLKFTSQFKKDYKRIQNQPEKLKALDAVLSALAATGTVPQEYLPHPLSGNWSAWAPTPNCLANRAVANRRKNDSRTSKSSRDSQRYIAADS